MSSRNPTVHSEQTRAKNINKSWHSLVHRDYEYARPIVKKLHCTKNNFLSTTQQNLETIYEISAPQNIYDFLITNKWLVQVLPNRSIDENALEQSLISTEDNFLDILFHLDGKTLVKRIDNGYPSYHPDENDLHDFWVALKGISHFLYAVSQPELRAEVEKFVSATIATWLEKDNALMQEI